MAENQYVVFKLGNGDFGIDIINVKGIGLYEKSISIPNSQDFVEGLIISLGEKEVGFIVDEVDEIQSLEA